ncbi:hypothetical protein BsWGS_09959 [Bradybaena similaris]
MIESKLWCFTTFSGLFGSRQLCHRSLQTSCLRVCLGRGRLQTFASPEENLAEGKGSWNGCSFDLCHLDAVRQKSDTELKVSEIISGQYKVTLAGKMLNSSHTKIQISKCLQANILPAAGVKKSSNCQHLFTSRFCLNMTHPSRNLLNSKNCECLSIRNYHIPHVSLSSSLSSVVHKHLIRSRYQVLASCLSLLSGTLSSALDQSSVGISDRSSGKASEKSVSNGELNENYGHHISKGDCCGSHETLSLKDSSCGYQGINAVERNDMNYEHSKETTQVSQMFSDNCDGNHDVYAEFYFNLVSEKHVMLQNVHLDHPDEEASQTFNSNVQMYSGPTKSGGTGIKESEVRLTHIDTDGKAVMVDVGDKTTTLREAQAEGRIYLGPEAARLVKDNKMKKGDVLTVAQIAGITAAKQTSQLIPLCHNINLTKVHVACVLNEKCDSVDITSLVRTIGVTGVEMEALTAVSIAALTVYDMCKAVTHDMVISDVRLVSKSGGKRDFQRSP